MTTAAGRFMMRDIEPGKYWVSASKRGYARTNYGGRGTWNSVTLSLDPGQHLADIVLRMPPQAVITGRVLDDDGEPQPNVDVFLLRYAFSQGKRQLEQWDRASTNDLGEYRIFGLAPGRYYLGATANGMVDPDRYDSGQGYAPTYYPGTSDRAGAKAIELQSGTILRSVDINLLKTRTARVCGRVLDPTSRQAAQGVGVALRRRDESQYMFDRALFSNVEAQGNFEIKGVIPGAYFVEASRRVDDKIYSAQLPVDVHESDINGIVLELNPGAELNGRLRLEGRSTSGLAGARLSLQSTNQNYRLWAGAQARADGSFTIPNIQPARYQLNVYIPDQDHYIKAARIGDQDVLKSGLDLTHGIDASLEIVVSADGGRIEGVVLNANEQPEAGAAVVLVPDKPRRDQFRLYQQSTTDQYGRFTINNIAPGGYKLFAWEEIEYSAYEDPEFLKAFEPLGEPKVVREGSRESAQLKLIPSERAKPARN
jgi:protocatechuate 3,4-dioxygenase beta subunit